MDLRTLRFFIAVLEAGSLSRAAASLYIAQPALTARIKKLENELGAQLLERSHAGVTPTPAGLQLYEDARRLLSDVDAVRERIQRLPKGPEGSVTVALPFLLASLLAGPLLARLQVSHPRIRVFIRDNLSLLVRQSMDERRAEIGVLVDTPLAEGLECRPLARESIYFCGRDDDGSVQAWLKPSRASSVARRPRLEIDFEKAARLPLLLQSRRFAIRRQVEEAALARGVALNIAHEHDSTRVIRSLFMAGAGFAFTPACSLHDAPARGGQWLLARVAQPRLQRTYTVATASDKPLDAAAQVVLQVLGEQVRELINSGRWDARWLGARWCKRTD